MKTMKRILSLVLVCVMLVGATAAFGISASAEDQTIAIVAKNVYYGDTLQLMYAVSAPVLNAGDEVKVTLYADEACTLKFCDATENGTVNHGGVSCKKFYASKGVPAQDMNLVVYAKAEIVNNGTTVASTVFAYSVLQYFNELYYSAKSSDAQKALASSVIAYAKAAEAVLYNTADKQANRVSAPVADTKFVSVDANVTGVAQGVYAANATPFANIATDLVAGEGETIVWTVTDLDTGVAVVYELEDLKALALTANVKVSVEVVAGAVDPTPETGMSIADALAAADGTAITVAGTVIAIDTPYNDTYKNISVYIEDANGDRLYLYRLEAEVAVGDIIVVTGTVETNYGVKRAAAGATAEIYGQGEVAAPSEMTVAEALAAKPGDGVILTGTVAGVDSSNSVTITDGNGNYIVAYKLGSGYAIGDIITVTGTIGFYNVNQISTGATAVKTGTCAHENASAATCTEEGVCPVCGTVTAEKIDHVDANGDNACDSCGTNVGADAPVESTVTMTVAGTTGTLASDNSTISWTGSNFTIVNAKAGSTSQIRTSDSDHFRTYAHNSLTISALNGEKMTQLVFTATGSSYANDLANAATNAGYTASASGTTVTITLDSETEFSIADVTKQVRWKSVEITYVA